MRFLCLHGIGTNSHVLEMQTAAIRYELGDSHTYEFVEGTHSAPISEDIKLYYPATEDYFSYYLADPQSILEALDQLDKYVQEEGPFHGVIGFSQGAGLLATYLIRSSEKSVQKSLPFQCAVFFSAGNTFDWRALEKGQVKLLERGEGQPLISLPTAHIWGQKDEKHLDEIQLLSRICDKRSRHNFVHSEGHEIPGARMGDAVQGCVAAIRRVVEKANVDI